MTSTAPSLGTHPAADHAIKSVKRSSGQSAVARIAYVSRARLRDDRTGLTNDHRRAKDLVAVETCGTELSPADLANAMGSAERRKHSQVARGGRSAGRRVRPGARAHRAHLHHAARTLRLRLRASRKRALMADDPNVGSVIGTVSLVLETLGLKDTQCEQATRTPNLPPDSTGRAGAIRMEDRANCPGP